MGKNCKKNRRKKLVDKQGGVCFYCNTRPAHTIDHIIPKSIVNYNHRLGLIGACDSCNNDKDDVGVVKYVKENHPERLDELKLLLLRRIQRLKWATSHDFKVPGKPVALKFYLLHHMTAQLKQLGG